jgi:hypothetical protein
MFKGYKAKYVYLVGGIVLLSITVSLFSLLVREYFLLFALGDILITLALLGGILIYVVRNPEKTKDLTPPEDARCLYCNAYITREEGLCYLKVDSKGIYFDSLDHLKKFMKEVDFFLERKEIPRGRVVEAYAQTSDEGRWKKIENIEDEELKELFNFFKDRLSGD